MMPTIQHVQNVVKVIGAIVHVSTESPSDGAGKPSLMAGKNNDSRILRATHIIVGASSADSHFFAFYS
jgi:hypothetical protein